MPDTRLGFSLVELSIVLVILGLLTGGILAGQSLIRAAQLRSVSTEYSRYYTATQTFRDKYMALPGDMTNATKFWGLQAGCAGNCLTVPSGTETFDGNGDGTIQCIGCDLSTTGNETYRFWQQLANAGLIEGQYTGVPAAAPALPEWGWASKLGVNVPTSRFSNSGWSIFWIAPKDISDVNWFEGDYGNMMIFGGADSTGLTWVPMLTPEDAWNIDTKLDDGKPATGRVVTNENQGGQCSDLAASAAASLAASQYKLTNATISCTLVMKSSAN
ncbi:MAG: type II secretion system protein [Rickettsiales bacterium]